MWFESTENGSFLNRNRHELNGGEFCWLLEGILTDENILP